MEDPDSVNGSWRMTSFVRSGVVLRRLGEQTEFGRRACASLQCEAGCSVSRHRVTVTPGHVVRESVSLSRPEHHADHGRQLPCLGTAMSPSAGSLRHEASVVVIDWNDLLQTADADRQVLVETAIEQAYGAGGTGLLAVRHVPGFVEAKRRLFQLAHQLVHLPHDYLEKELTDRESLYNAGWSFGKEKLGDTPDTSKGSFYFNPVTDTPGTPEDRQKYPLSYPNNLWPSERLPELEPAAKTLGCLLTRVAVQVSHWIDGHAKGRNPHYKDQYLHSRMKDTDKVKGRLLYYFPLSGNDADQRKEDSWYGGAWSCVYPIGGTVCRPVLIPVSFIPQ